MKYEVITTGESTIIRSGPGSSFGQEMVLPGGTKLTAIGEENGFYKLTNGGYINKSYAKVVKNLEGDTMPSNEHVYDPNVSKEKLASYNERINTQPTARPTDLDASDAALGFGSSGPGHQFAPKGKLGQSDIESVPKTPPQTNPKLPESYYGNYDFVRANLKKIRNNHNILNSMGDITKIRKDMFRKFNRFKHPFPDTELAKSFGYVFFVRPDLNLFEGTKLRKEIDRDPFFSFLYKSEPEILKSLTASYVADHDFHPLLSNRAQSFEIQDEYIKTEEIGETFTGYKTRYARNNIDSKTAGNFSVQFADDHRLNVYRSVKAWMDYASNVYRGEFSPREEYTLIDKVIDYAGAAYYFLCAEDGETIIFWSKYFGIIPTTAPSSNFSYSKGNFVSTPEITVNFDYSSKEDLNPITIYEFNQNSRGGLFYKRIYEQDLIGSGKSMAGAPFIESSQVGGEYELRLKFRI